MILEATGSRTLRYDLVWEFLCSTDKKMIFRERAMSSKLKRDGSMIISRLDGQIMNNNNPVVDFCDVLPLCYCSLSSYSQDNSPSFYVLYTGSRRREIMFVKKLLDGIPVKINSRIFPVG